MDDYAALALSEVIIAATEESLWPFPDRPVAEPDPVPWRVRFEPQPQPWTEAVVADLAGRLLDEKQALEAESQLLKFEIQQRMSEMTQSETLEADIRKKTQDAANAIMGKI